MNVIHHQKAEDGGDTIIPITLQTLTTPKEKQELLQPISVTEESSWSTLSNLPNVGITSVLIRDASQKSDDESAGYEEMLTIHGQYEGNV